MSGDILSSVFLLFAVMSLAASLTCLMGVGGKKNLHSTLSGVGFALLSACFVWLWAS